MNVLKKATKFISISLFILAFLLIVMDKSTSKIQPAMNSPESLKQDGCLGLNYHRVRKDHIITKALEKLTVSNELRIYSIYESEFEQHINFLLENNAAFVTPTELREFRETGNYPDNCIWISFDDVDKTVYENAFPILKKYQIPFTLFVIAGHVGEEDYENLNLATWDQLQKMVDSGLATIGSHTYDMHQLQEDRPIFFDLNKKDAFFKDLVKSKQTIESELKNVEVVDFAYPYGDGKEELVPLIKEAGFLSSYILAKRIISEENDLFWQNRILVDDMIFKNTVMPWVKNHN